MCIAHTTFLNLESQTNLREKEMSKLTPNLTLAMLTLVQQEIISHTESRDQGDEQANPDPNPSPQPLVSLCPSSRALIKPIEVDNGEKCAAALCRIQHFRGKNVQWVLCELCNSWLHVYCEHVTKQELKLIHKYVCHSCKC